MKFIYRGQMVSSNKYITKYYYSLAPHLHSIVSWWSKTTLLPIILIHLLYQNIDDISQWCLNLLMVSSLYHTISWFSVDIRMPEFTY